jgi:3-oxoadipate enol-lactonase
MTDVRAGDVRLHCVVDGPADAPVLVLCNSIATDLHVWEPQAASFAQRFRTIRYDGRGHGRSGVPRGPYTIDQLGGDLVRLMDALDVEVAHVCGLSLGGLVAQWVTARHPRRVGRAVFASTAARIGTPELWEERAELVRNGGMAAVRDLQLRRFFTESFLAHNPDLADRVGRAVASTPPEGYVGSCLALRDADLTGLASTIRTPSLIIAGREDVATPPSDAEWLHEHIPGSRIAFLDDAGHLCNVEKPDRFNELVLGFLSGSESP